MPQVSVPELVHRLNTTQVVISFPTDTVPALAARPEQADLLFATKQRSLEKPLILMGGSIDDLWPFIAADQAEGSQWQQLAARYWPGALTLVLPASDRLPKAMNPLDPSSIGIRVPNHPLACTLLAKTGPLATTSANRSGEPALQTLAEIEAAFPKVLTLSPDAIADLGFGQADLQATSVSGIPSTVAKWENGTWNILRQGAVTLDI